MPDYIVNQTKQLENGVWVIAKGDQQWDDELNYDLQKLDDIIGEVKAIPKSGKLEIIQGDQKLGEFDPKTGANARIEIPEPNDLGDLTLTQGGKTLGFYRGNAKTIDIPVPKEPETLTIKQAGKVLGTYSGEAAEITIPKAADPVKLTVKQGSNILGTYIPNQASEAVISIPIPPDQTLIEPLVLTQNGVTLGTYDGTDATIDIPVPQVTVGKLTVKQGAMTLGVYSGSELQIDIPENPAVQTLTLKQGENVLGTYSGSEEEIEIPEQKIGTLTVTKGSKTLGSFTSDESATIDIPENKTLTIKQNGTEIGTYSGLHETEINLTDTRPQTLTLKQGENVLGVYDGTEEEIEIPEHKIGTLTVTKGSVSLGSFTSDESATIEIPENKTLTIKQNGTEIGTYSGLYDAEINLTDTKPQTLTIKQGEYVLGTYDGTANTINIPESGGSSGFNPSFDYETYVPVYANISSGIEFISESREYLESNPNLNTGSDYYREYAAKAEAEEALIEELRTANIGVSFEYPKVEIGDISKTITYRYTDEDYDTQNKTEEFEGKAYAIAIRPDEFKKLRDGISYRISGLPSGINGEITGFLVRGFGPDDFISALSSYGSDDYGSDDYGSDDYGSDDYGSDDYGSDDYGSDDYGSDDYGSDDYGSDDYGSDDYGSDDYGSDDYGSDDYGSDDYGSDDYGSDDYGSDDYGSGSGSGGSGVKNKYWCGIKIIVSHDSQDDITVSAVLSSLKTESDSTERTFKTLRTVLLAD